MAEMNANVPLRDAPNGNPTGKIAHAGDSLNVSESRDGWSRVEIVNVGRDKGWVQSTFIDNATAAAAVAPIDPQKFANACVIQALINGVNPHYLVGVAKLRSGISGGDAGNRIGPFRLTAEEWQTIVPPFTTDDITSNNQQIAGFAFMVQRQLKTLGDSATPVALYRAQWPDAPADIAAQLKTAFDDTAAIEAKAEQDVLDPPADPAADPPASGGQFGGEISGLPISQRAYNLIVAFEVSGEAVYNKPYRHPEWPGGKSGVTVGIGYDVGYRSAAQLSNDWKNEIPDPMIGLLQTVRGLTGQAAANALASVSALAGCHQRPQEDGYSPVGRHRDQSAAACRAIKSGQSRRSAVARI